MADETPTPDQPLDMITFKKRTKTMKPMKPTLTVAALCAALLLLVVCAGRQTASTSKASVLEMSSVPDGHLLASLQLRGQEQMLNFKIQDGSLRCINSTDQKLVGIYGRFDRIGNGVFFTSLQGEGFRASQYWLFRPNGSAVIKEIPDRGEQQTAVPVNNDSIQRRETR